MMLIPWVEGRPASAALSPGIIVGEASAGHFLSFIGSSFFDDTIRFSFPPNKSPRLVAFYVTGTFGAGPFDDLSENSVLDMLF